MKLSRKEIEFWRKSIKDKIYYELIDQPALMSYSVKLRLEFDALCDMALKDAEKEE